MSYVGERGVRFHGLGFQAEKSRRQQKMEDEMGENMSFILNNLNF